MQGALGRRESNKVLKCLGLDQGGLHRLRTTRVHFVGNREPGKFCKGMMIR